MMRETPNKAFTIAETHATISILNKVLIRLSEKHLDSVRKQLNEFYQRDWISHTQISRNRSSLAVETRIAVSLPLF